MSLSSLVKIVLDDHKELFLSSSYESGENLSVTLLDLRKCEAYTGSVRDIDLRSQAARINMTFSDFVRLTKKALLQKESGNEQFLYCLEKNCSDFLFQWKCIDHEETVVNIGSIKVTENDFSSMVRNIFLTISEELITLNEKMLNMETELLKNKKEKEDALQLLSKATDMKESIEKELFSKFILVLNEKKRKIKELKQSSTSGKRTKTSNKQAKAVHQLSESSDEATSDVEKRNVAVPSTSKKNDSLLFFSDDESDQLKVSPSKKRVRNKVSGNENVNRKEQKTSIKDVPMKSESDSDDLFGDL